MANLFLTWSVRPDIVKRSPTHADTDAQTNPIFARALGSGSRGAWLRDTRNHIQTSKLILEPTQKKAFKWNKKLFAVVCWKKIQVADCQLEG